MPIFYHLVPTVSTQAVFKKRPINYNEAMLCLVLNAPTTEEDLRILERNRRYVQMAELRVDTLKDPLTATDFPDKAGLPVILTIRRTRDGGMYTGSEDSRKELLRELSQGNFSYVDMEVDLNFPSLEYDLMARGVGIIRSMHDFNGIPKDLPELAKVVASCGEIPKIAVTLSSQAELDEFAHNAELMKGIPRKILIGMGHFGMETRVRYKQYGSMLTFCAESNPVAVGLIPPEELSNLISSDLD